VVARILLLKGSHDDASIVVGLSVAQAFLPVPQVAWGVIRDAWLERDGVAGFQ
jgi:hypothetical protein